MEKNQVWWLWWGSSWEAEGGWELSCKSFSKKVSFQQTPEGENGVSQKDFRERKTMQAEGRANVKALWKQYA